MNSFFQTLAAFFTDPQKRNLHREIIGVALVMHLALHYATYVPDLRPVLADLPYFKLHALHEAEFLLIVVYAGIVFRLKGGLLAVGITAVSSIPFVLTPYIFGRVPREGEITDLAIQVAVILAMGLLIVLFYESVTRIREVRLALTTQLEGSNQQLDSANRQLHILNSNIQTELNTMLESLGEAEATERLVNEHMGSSPAKDQVVSFLDRLREMAQPRV